MYAIEPRVTTHVRLSQGTRSINLSGRSAASPATTTQCGRKHEAIPIHGRRAPAKRGGLTELPQPLDRMIGRKRPVEVHGRGIDDRERDGKNSGEALRFGHDPKPLMLLRMCPVIKLHHTETASMLVIAVRATRPSPDGLRHINQ